MTVDVGVLASQYETALAAHQDEPGDGEKRVAAAEAGQRLSDARAAQRRAEGRVGVGVVTSTVQEG